MSTPCARCGAELPRVDGDVAAFCAACGLRRLRISPDARVAIHEDGQADAPHATHGTPTVLDWAAALKSAAAVSLLCAAGPALLPGAVAAGTAGGMSLLLIPLMVLAVVSLYHRSRPRREVTPLIGSRLGAVLGMMVGAWSALITGAVGFVQRYRYHSRAMDDVFRQSTDAMAQRLQGSPVLPDALKLAQSPEFHAASFMLSHLFSLLIMVFGGSVCGWMAGAALRSRRQRLVR